MALQFPTTSRTAQQQHVLLNGLLDMYRHQVLTDCTLVVDTHRLPCHRLVLAASSPYFRAMFTTNLSEVHQEEVELHDVEPEAMSQILDYLYSTTIDITHDNVQSIFTAASLFEILDLCALCASYMAQELCVANCVTVYQFASFHNCPALKSTSRAFVVNHFDGVVDSEDLLTLSAADLGELLSDDNLNIAHEERVFDCLIHWTERDIDQRKKHFAKLFKLVRFALISDEFLSDKVLSHELVQTNSYCGSVLSMVRLYKVMQDQTNVSNIMEEMETSATPRLGMYNRPMMVFVGGSQEFKQRALTCFDPKTKKNYYAIPLHVSFDFKYRIDHHRIAVTDTGQIFLVGGIFYEDHHFEEAGLALREVMTFDAYSKAWIDCTPLRNPRCAHSLVHLDGRLYAIGGKSSYPAGQSLDSVECYDIEHNEWNLVSALPYALCHHGSVVYGGKIYVVGGVMSEGALGAASSKVLEYDPLLDIWTATRRPMHTPRAEFGIALLENRLYVIGGCNGEQKLSTMEIYDFETNTWKYGEDFPEERKSMATAVYDGNIYVCGGVRTVISRMNRAQRLVETKDLWKLNPKERIPLWTREVKLVQYANVHACVVTEINTKRVHESEFVSR